MFCRNKEEYFIKSFWFLFSKVPLFKAGHLYQWNTISCHFLYAVKLQFKLLRHKVIILMVSGKVSSVSKSNDNLNQLHVIIAAHLTAQLIF